jgi:hypothetical protein
MPSHANSMCTATFGYAKFAVGYIAPTALTFTLFLQIPRKNSMMQIEDNFVNGRDLRLIIFKDMRIAFLRTILISDLATRLV